MTHVVVQHYSGVHYECTEVNPNTKIEELHDNGIYLKMYSTDTYHAFYVDSLRAYTATVVCLDPQESISMPKYLRLQQVWPGTIYYLGTFDEYPEFLM